MMEMEINVPPACVVSETPVSQRHLVVDTSIGRVFLIVILFANTFLKVIYFG